MRRARRGNASYSTFATFRDPDGNRWLIQEVTTRLPGRVDAPQTAYASVDDLAQALRRAAAAHGEHEARDGGKYDETGRTGTRRTWSPSGPAPELPLSLLCGLAQLRLLWRPSDGLLMPPMWSELMSYCTPTGATRDDRWPSVALWLILRGQLN